MEKRTAEFNNASQQKINQQNLVPGNHISVRRAAWIGLFTFLTLAIFVAAFIYQRIKILRETQKDEAIDLINDVKARLNESLASSLSATKTLSFFIQDDGSIKDFDSIAPQIIKASTDIDAVQMVPNGVIRYIYPLQGNESVIGYDILHDPQRNREAYKAIQNNELYFAGPLTLRQGGTGVVGRLPVFKNGKFWGFTAVVIRMPTLLKAARIDSTGESGYYFQLSKINANTGKEDLFIPYDSDMVMNHSVSVMVPNGSWKLSISPVDKFKNSSDIIWLASLGLLFSILGGIFAYKESSRPQKLKELVLERTRQLKESEENYKILFQKSPLPLWIYDEVDFKFLDANEAAVTLYGYSREDFLQKTVLDIRREDEFENFFGDTKNNSPELRDAGIWNHLKKNGEEIQVLIFSKSIIYNGKSGRLVLLMDVSEKIKVENELIKSEEKYRSLIEQASDGIILYSFDGTIHSFNKAAYVQTGYTKEEFKQLNLKDLFFESGIFKNRAGSAKISNEQSATLYRKLKRKDGSLFIVELNTRMLPDGKIIAIVRDITERQKMEDALKESEEKFSKAFHSNLLGLALYDTDFRFVDSNDMYAGMLHSTPKDLIGQLAENAGMLSKTDPSKKQALGEEIQQLIDMNGQVTNFELELLQPGGKPTAILVSLEPLRLINKQYWLTSAIDITSKRNAELLLKENELKYRSLIEQASDGIVITDLQGNIQEVNQSISNMSGYNIDEMLGKHLHQFIPQDDIKIKPLRIQELTEGKSLLYQRQLLKKDGSKLEVEVNSKMASPNTLIGFVRDITERKQSEEALMLSEEKYRTLVEQASDAIFIADKEGKFLVVNSSGYQLTKYSEEEFKQLTIYDLVLAEDISKDPFHFEKMQNNMVARHERRLKCKDGSLVEVEVTAKFISGNRFLAFVRDITERKRNEYVLRYQARLLEAVSDAITSLDTNRCIVSWNKASEELYGFTAEEVMGQRIPEIVTFEYPYTNNEEVFKQVYNEGQWKGEFNFIHPHNKRKYHLLSSINILKDNEGHNIGFIITSSDITNRKKAEEEIAKSNERFELIAQATNEAVWDHDYIKDETWGNKNLYELYGFKNLHEKINLDMFLEKIHPSEKAGVVERMALAIKKRATSLSEEFRFKTAGGGYRNFYDRAYVKYDDQGLPVRILGAMQDITDREVIKKQILKEKELSDSIINSLPGIFYLFNKEGKFLRWNKNFETVTGYTEEEMRKLHPLELFDEEDKALLKSKIENVFISGHDNVEVNFLLKNKQKIPYYFTGQAIEYEGETSLMGVGLDFSDKEKAKQAILESEAKYKELIEQASDAIFISDPQGKYIDVNTIACKMLGYSKEELLAMSGSDILYHPEHAENIHLSYDNLKAGKSYIRETTLKRKDGSTLEVESSSKMLSDGRFIGIVRDLSERKKADMAIRESEERYRTLVDNATEALVVMDMNRNKFVNVSESALKLFKMSREELLSISFNEVSPVYQPDGRLSLAASTEKLQQAIEGKKPSFEWTYQDKNGNLIPCEVWLVRLPSENEVLIRGSIIDITERKKAAEAIKANAELLRELYSYLQNIREEERTHIAREIHDELGQQLTGLKMDLFWINRHIKNEDEAINKKLESTLELIDTTISTVRKIATELRPSILDDLGLVAALEWQGEEFEKRSGINVQFSSLLDDLFVLPHISTALFRVYQELLTNIARHSKAGLVKTTIYKEAENMYLKVEDDGIGFDMKKIIGKKTLGLRGIEERTSLIGGNYEIKSSAGNGTFVLISVPLHNAPSNLK